MVIERLRKAVSEYWHLGFIIAILGVIYYYINPVVAGLIVSISATYFSIRTMIQIKNIFDLKSLFIGSWGITLGLAMMRLLVYQKEWSIYFLLVLLIGLGFFLIGLKRSYKIKISTNIKSKLPLSANTYDESVLFYIVMVATIIAISMFIISYCITGIIPAFSNELTAYIDHYTRFYVIQVGMMPAGGLALWLAKRITSFNKRKILLILIALLHLVVFPLLYVARGTFIIGILFTLPVIYDAIENKKAFLWGISLSLIIAFLIISISRNYTSEQYHYFFKPRSFYLYNWKFKLPPFLSMVYGYLTVSHDNASLNIMMLESHTLGGFLLEPFNTIIRSELPEMLRARNPLVNISDGLNTHNMFGLLYYDFGLLGVAIIMYIYGLFSGILENLAKDYKSPFILLLFGGVIIVTVMGFFTAWTTQFTLWMWWGTVLIFWILSEYFTKKRGKA